MNPKTRQQAHTAAMLFLTGACLIEKAAGLWIVAAKAQRAAAGPLKDRDLDGGPRESDEAMQERLLTEVMLRMGRNMDHDIEPLTTSCKHLQAAMKLIENAPFQATDDELSIAFSEGRDSVVRELVDQLRPFYLNPVISLLIGHEIDTPIPGLDGVKALKMDSFNEHSPSMLADMFQAMAEAQGETQDEPAEPASRTAH